MFAASNEGWVRIFDAQSGKVLWEVDAKQPVKTVNGVEKTGGLLRIGLVHYNTMDEVERLLSALNEFAKK